MRPRDAAETHRAATPLELLFDLCFVVAVALVAARFHHALAENHVGAGLAGYVMVFFAIWWAWMNFTWFASAYDTDDGLYRVATLLQITGVLILAAGVPRAFDSGDFGLVVLGYVVMRLAMVGQWIRAALADPEHRTCALRYVVGITVVQAFWIARLAVPTWWWTFPVLALAEISVPIWAEWRTPTSYHPEHIAERYGLFTLIVLGESVLAATTALQTALDSGHGGAGLLTLALAGLVIVFSMWWLYFDQQGDDLLTTMRSSLIWGYGHLLIFASAAAVGVGLQVAVDFDTHVAHLPALGAGYATAIPVALYLLSLWRLQVHPHQQGRATVAYLAVSVLVLLTPFTGAPVQVIAGLLAALVVTTAVIGRTRRSA